jgi:hypothetical protein
LRVLSFDRQGRVLQKLQLPDFVGRPSGLTLRTSQQGDRTWLSVCFYGPRAQLGNNPGVAVFEVTSNEVAVVEIEE